jgi:hypothetical protein
VAESGYTKIDVFFSAPGDIQKELAHAQWAIDELNETIGRDRRVFLQLRHWQSHTVPDMGRPQGVITEQISDYDVYVGVMWCRFGTPTGKAGSGTEEEFNLAYESWENSNRPRIMFYFNQSAYMPRTLEENDQMRSVLEFRDRISKVGLTRNYETLHEFGRSFREHLAKFVLSRWESSSAGEEDPVEPNAAPKEPASIPKAAYGPINDPSIRFPIVRFYVANLDSVPFLLRTTVDVFLDGTFYGRPVRHYSGRRPWNCNPGARAFGWFGLTHSDQMEVDEAAKDLDPLTAQTVMLRVQAALVLDDEEHELLPVEWYYNRDSRLWIYDS